MTAAPGPRADQVATAADRQAAFLQWLSPHLPRALEQVSVPSFVLDRSGRIRWLNGAAKKLVGDATGQLFTSVIDHDQVRSARNRFAETLRGVPQPDFAVDLVGLDGRESRVEISSVPLRSGHHAVGVFGFAVPSGKPRRDPQLDERLTRRQLEILRQLADGSSTEQIAARCNISRETVRNHIRHILRRLGARSRLEAVAIAHRGGLL